MTQWAESWHYEVRRLDGLPPVRAERILDELRRLRMRAHLTVAQRQLALRLKP